MGTQPWTSNGCPSRAYIDTQAGRHHCRILGSEYSAPTSRHVQHERTAHRPVAGSPWKPYDKLSSPQASLILLQKSSTCQAATSTERTATCSPCNACLQGKARRLVQVLGCIKSHQFAANGCCSPIMHMQVPYWSRAIQQVQDRWELAAADGETGMVAVPAMHPVGKCSWS